MDRLPAQILDPARLAAVRATGLLDTEPDDGLDRLASLAATLLEAPFAFVTLVDERRSFWKAAIGDGLDGARENTVEESFCQYVIAEPGVLLVDEAANDPLTCRNPSIQGMGVAAWAGATLVGPDGHALGSFCVVDTRKRTWTDRDAEVLRTLAEAAAMHLARDDARARGLELGAERERLAADLEAERALLADLLTRTAAGVTVWEGRELRCRMVNDAGRALMIERGEAMGRRMVELYPELQPTIHNDLLPIFDTGQDVVVEGMTVSSHAPDAFEGQRFYDVTFSPVWTGGVVTAVMATALDTTQLVGSASRLQGDLESERSTTELLQTALLPGELVPVPGVDVAVRYRAADDRATVGGDFYDLFRADDGAFLAVVGDVCGKGPRAAAITGMARWTLRSQALHTSDPAALLEHLNHVASVEPSILQDGEFITMAVVRLQARAQATGYAVTVAQAGHPPTVHGRAGGDHELLGATGPMIGVDADVTYGVEHTALAPGDTLLLYSDGLLDAQAPHRQLEPEDLLPVLRASTDAEAAVDALMRTAVGDRPIRDDIVVLTLFAA